MKKIKWAYLVILLFGLIINGSALARGGGGHGGHFGGGFSGHFGGHGYGGGHYWRHHYGGFHGGPAFRFYVGPGFGWPYYAPYYPPYYSPYYGYPPAVNIVPQAPTIYIQRGEGQSTPQPPANYWHYCRNPEGYYPYVKECPGGWQQVSPQPPVH
ncbi:MAG: hypothetical protein PHY16_12230 [Methylobacter sp.]|nr:hypothetical protein [Methylobacter sp.]